MPGVFSRLPPRSPHYRRSLPSGQVKTDPRPKLGAPPPESRPTANLRIDTNLVLVPVSVLDPTNRPVTGLEKEHFRVLEDKRGADHHPLLDGRRAGCRRTGLRHQRQHGAQTTEIAPGRRRVLPDIQSRRRVFPGGVQRPAEAGRAAHARRAKRSRINSRGHNPRAAPRCSTPFFWR